MLALALALTMTQAACFGSFNLTRTVWKFNKNASGNQWVQELIFLVLIVVPVYEIAAVVDVLVINTIEFWTGSNPVNAGAGMEVGDERIVQLDDGTEAVLVLESADTLRIERAGEVIRVRKDAGTFTTLDGEGNVLSIVREADGGAIERVDADGVHRVEAWEIAGAGSDLGALRGLAAAAP